jgi:hypothetical protein
MIAQHGKRVKMRKNSGDAYAISAFYRVVPCFNPRDSEKIRVDDWKEFTQPRKIDPSYLTMSLSLRRSFDKSVFELA